MRALPCLLVIGSLWGAACGEVEERSQADSGEDRATESSSSSAAGLDRSQQRKIVAFGDSLTAGFGIDQNEAYPAQLQRRLDAAGLPFEVVNSGHSGETTAGGLRRLEWALTDLDVAVVILALGGNDGLRGLPPGDMKQNLASMIDIAEAHQARVLLAGIIPPPNQGERYSTEFGAVFTELAAERDVDFMPFLLVDVAGVAELNQSDGIHPNPEGAAIIADNVLGYLEPMLSLSEVATTQ